ncbi:MAG: Type 1 glutamine amidotransferase-like domain-containing protein [Lachnospiraceae bacterium]|nr:Type 1 glutamine amidotransferase-like domain-containing protein [Lachnospiraceae bacterium]
MIVFLTSSPCADAPAGVDVPFILDESNQFVENLKQYVKVGCKCLMVCADPFNYEHNDRMAREFRAGFAYHGLIFEDMVMCDHRNKEALGELIQTSGMIILAGGHVPTQNLFLQKNKMRELLQGFDGVIMGISAGSMNCADTVYAHPEMEGESIDPNYQRFIRGLGLTDVNVMPHYQKVKYWWLDGKPLYEGIACPDSFGRTFYGLPDGSYVLCKDGKETIYGEAHKLSDGVFTQICWPEETFALK